MKKFLIKLKKIQSRRPIRIVFVCTANCGRSPIAEILFEKFLINEFGSMNNMRKKNLIIESAGTLYSGLPIAPKSAKRLIAEENIPEERCSKHRGRSLDEIEEPDLLLTMESSHIPHLATYNPAWKNKAFPLDEFVKKDLGKEGRNIADPAGQSDDTYRLIKDQIKQDLILLLNEFKDTGLVF
jgi:protein-tyrosine-phosphatase